MSTYDQTRARLETYFDRTAAKTWERLTSDAPVSKIRQTVREGRNTMRATLLGCLPDDLRGMRVLEEERKVKEEMLIKNGIIGSNGKSLCF